MKFIISYIVTIYINLFFMFIHYMNYFIYKQNMKYFLSQIFQNISFLENIGEKFF